MTAMIQSEPRPHRATAPKPRSVRFWDKIAAKYARSPISDQAAYDRKLEMTQDYMTPEMAVFEFGCGTGTTALHHAPHVAHIRATDLSEAMITIAKDKAEAAGVTNVTFEASPIETLDAANASYDMVMAHSILHLVADQEAVLARAHAMLKPGGVFVSSTICLASAMPWVAPMLWAGRAIGVLPLVRMFRQSTLEHEMLRAGFVVEQAWQPGKRAAVFLIARKAG